jgi:hypothetical protein
MVYPYLQAGLATYCTEAASNVVVPRLRTGNGSREGIEANRMSNDNPLYGVNLYSRS